MSNSHASPLRRSRRGGSNEPGIVFAGTATAHSAIVLRALLAAGARIAGVITPAAPPAAASGLPVRVARPDDPAELAAQRGIPVVPVAGFVGDAVRPVLASLRPDLLLVACFPFILPAEVLGLAPCGGLNLHPSLLPAFRGPAPLFWQFRAGARRGGVTLHRMTSRIDAGPVIFRRGVALEAGLTATVLDARLARAGAALALRALDLLRRGRPLPETPQREERASYFALPRPRDFRLSRRWSAERAFRFIRGVAEWGVPFDLPAGGEVLRIRDALGYSEGSSLTVPFAAADGAVRIRFARGELLARLEGAPPESCEGRG